MIVEYYGNSDDIIRSMNLSEQDFDFTERNELRDFVIQKMVEIKNLIDEYCERDFSMEEKIPSAIFLISKQMTINYLMSDLMSRQSSITSYSDYQNFVKTEILTDDIKYQLDIFKRKTKSSFKFKCFKSDRR